MAGTTGSVATAEARIAEGYNFINVGADVVALGNYFMGLKKELDEKFN